MLFMLILYFIRTEVIKSWLKVKIFFDIAYEMMIIELIVKM